MPVTMTVVMYGFSIVVGVLFVALGLRIKPQKRAPSSSAHEHEPLCPLELAAPTHERIPLQFPNDIPELEELLPTDPRRRSSAPSSFLKVLKAPLRIFSRKRGSEVAEELEAPMAAGTVLSTVSSKKTPVSTPNEEKVP